MNIQATSHEMDCIVVGGGPAGAVLSLLLAQQGIKVMLLEAHKDFERDYRGDTVHASTVALLNQLGLMERMLRLPHTAGYDFPMHFPDGSVTPPPKPGKRRVSYSIKQSALLDMLVDEAGRSPTYRLVMGARVEDLVLENGVVRGVRYRAADGMHEVRAQLVVAADGRFSKVRQLAGLELQEAVESMDLLWLRLPKYAGDDARSFGIHNGVHHALVVSDRGDAWQIGLMLPKGGFATLRERGIDVLRDAIAETAPFLADRTHLLEDWRDTSLLNVRTGRLRQWYAPGVVAIGDAAHVMSPVFGVGINYAVQDAVVAANILGPRLLEQEVRVSDLASVQRSRELPTRLMLMMQRLARPRFSRAGKTNARPWQGLFMIVWPLSDVAQRLIALGGWRAERFAPGAVYEPTWQRAATVVLQAFAPLGYFGFLGYWPFSSR